MHGFSGSDLWMYRFGEVGFLACLLSGLGTCVGGRFWDGGSFFMVWLWLWLWLVLGEGGWRYLVLIWVQVGKVCSYEHGHGFRELWVEVWVLKVLVENRIVVGVYECRDFMRWRVLED